MTFKSIALGVFAVAALSLPARAATVTNLGFESGDLAGWTISDGFVSSVTSADDAIQTAPFGEHFLPTGGAYFAQVTAGLDVGTYSLLSQVFTISDTFQVSGDAAFLAFDSDPYNDDAYVRIYSADTDILLFKSDVLAVGDYGHTHWTHFTSGVLGAGIYTLEAGVRNNPEDLDNSYSSQLLIDSFAVVSVDAVPEPASWALMVLGFGGLGAMLRRRRVGATQIS